MRHDDGDGLRCSRLAYAGIQSAASPLLALRRLAPFLVPFLAACGAGPRTFVDVEEGRVRLDAEDVETLRGVLAAAGLAPRRLGVEGELASTSGNWVSIDDGGRVWELGLTAAPDLRSLAPLAGLSQLSRLWIGDVDLDGLGGLGGAASLRHLRIHRGGLRSLAGLDGCPELRVLDLRENAVVSTAELPLLPELRILDLADNALSSVSGLAGRKKLETLDLSGNALTAAAGLEDLPALERLHLSRNHLATLDGLRGLPRLRELLVDDNRLVDASALDTLPALELVNLNGNRLERFPRLVDRLAPHLWRDNPGSRLNPGPAPP